MERPKKITAILASFTILVLGGAVIMTAWQLQQRRRVAPTAPESRPKAAENLVNNGNFEQVPGEEKILFVSERDGNREIYSVNPDGTKTTRLTYKSNEDNSPRLFPDGSQIAFARKDSGGKYDLWVMNADGGDPVSYYNANLTQIPPIDFSPTEEKIVYSPDKKSISIITEANPFGVVIKQVYLVTSLDWAPNNKIYFTGKVSQADNSEDIWQINPDGTGLQAVGGTSKADNHAIVCGNYLFFSCYFQQELGNELDICRIGLDGSNLIELTGDASLEVAPVCAPNQQQISFNSHQEGNWEVYTMDLEGNNLQRITHNPAEDIVWDWGMAYQNIPNWTLEGDGTKEIVTDPVRGKVLHVQGPSARVIQWINIEAGKNYQVSITFKGLGGPSETAYPMIGADEWCFDANGNGSAMKQGLRFNDDCEHPNWDTREWNFTSKTCAGGSTGHRLAIFFDSNNAGQDIWGDDVVLTEVPTATPTQTPTPTNSPSPTPTTIPTATPTPVPTATPTPTPTPTVPQGTVNLQLKLKFPGIFGQGPDLPVRIKVNRNAVSYQELVTDVSANANGLYQSTTLNLSTDVLAADNYSLLIKGPKHLQTRYCLNQGQSRPCRNGQILLQEGVNLLDFSGYPMPAGDLPHPAYGQDGVVNSLDAVLLVSCFAAPTDPECLGWADLNYDGIISIIDMELMNQTIYSRWEDQ